MTLRRATRSTIRPMFLMSFVPRPRAYISNALVLLVCDWLLSGFAIDGLGSWAIAAYGMVLPQLVWWATCKYLTPKVEAAESEEWDSRLQQITWAVGFGGTLLVCPILLATGLPGLLTAEWISPGLTIDGIWTYAASCGLSALILGVLGELRPLMGLRNLGHKLAAEERVAASAASEQDGSST